MYCGLLFDILFIFCVHTLTDTCVFRDLSSFQRFVFCNVMGSHCYTCVVHWCVLCMLCEYCPASHLGNTTPTTAGYIKIQSWCCCFLKSQLVLCKDSENENLSIVPRLTPHAGQPLGTQFSHGLLSTWVMAQPTHILGVN